MGRKPTPTKLKVLRGNPGRRPINTDEPEPKPISGSDPPAYLLASEKAWWEHHGPALERLGLLTEADEGKFALLCRLLADADRYAKYLREVGDSYVIDTGMVRPQPEATMLRDARKHIDHLWSEFGGSPAARTGLSVPEKKQKLSIIAQKLG